MPGRFGQLRRLHMNVNRIPRVAAASIAAATVLGVSVLVGTATGHEPVPCPHGTSPGVQCLSHEGETVILGTNGPDVIVGTDGPDEIQAKDGNDRVDARGGDDTVIGLRGADVIDGGDGNDSLNADGGGATG